MNDHNETAGNENDLNVSAAYKASRRPKTPEHLDVAILGQAAGAVGGRSWLTWTNQWLRPATYVATLGICVALLININEALVFDEHEFATPQSIDAASSENGSQAAAFRDAAHEIALRIREADLVAEPQLQGMPENGYHDSAESGLQGMPENVYHDSSAQQNSDGQNPAMSCEKTQRLTAESWESCINELQALGESAAAVAELGLLQSRFPDYQIDATQ